MNYRPDIYTIPCKRTYINKTHFFPRTHPETMKAFVLGDVESSHFIMCPDPSHLGQRKIKNRYSLPIGKPSFYARSTISFLQRKKCSFLMNIDAKERPIFRSEARFIRKENVLNISKDVFLIIKRSFAWLVYWICMLIDFCRGRMLFEISIRKDGNNNYKKCRDLCFCVDYVMLGIWDRLFSMCGVNLMVFAVRCSDVCNSFVRKNYDK